MKKMCGMVVAGLLLCSLTGCAWFSKFTAARVRSKITRCVTTEADLRRTYGAPGAIGAKDNYMAMTWFYNFLGWDTTPDSLQRKLVVFVNHNRIVVDYAFNPHGEAVILDQCSP